MRKISLGVIFVLFSSMMTVLMPARAIADQECLDTCLQRNYATQFCTEKCSGANPLIKQQSDRRVEPTCFSDCTSTGHDQADCTKACVY